jgi:DNA-binding transcriptional LysR family regulator/lysophospholipase L1-like esterase
VQFSAKAERYNVDMADIVPRRSASLVTLEQARVLDALARHGTLQRAAAALGKGHSSVIYALKTLEDALGLALLDRSGYRLRLTPAGDAVLGAARGLLEAERQLEDVVHQVKSGWEPRLTIVVDGVCPTAKLFETVGVLAREAAATRVDVHTEFLGGVERAFEELEADLMIAVLPIGSKAVTSTALADVDAHLVAHKRHPLAQKSKLALADLAESLLLTVKGSDPRLSLPTASLESQSRVVLPDFAAKKTAILTGVGFGWMPGHLIERELERGELVRLDLGPRATHRFAPRLYRRRGRKLGRAGQRVYAALVATLALLLALLGCEPHTAPPVPAEPAATSATFADPHTELAAPITSSSTSPPPRPTRRYAVAAIGDSLSDPKAHGGKYLETLAARCKGSRFDTYGRGGEMVSQMRRRFARDVLGEGGGPQPVYTHVLVLGGVADVGSSQTASRTLEKVQADLLAMYRMAHERGLGVIALTLPPWGAYPLYDDDKHRMMLALNEWLRTRPEPVAHVVDVFPKLVCGDRALCAEYAADKIHWNAAGHELVGAMLYEQVFADCE